MLSVEGQFAPSWPNEGLEFVGQCPVCGSRARRILHRELCDSIFFCAPGLWTLHECTDCRTAYLDPRPSRETISLAYRAYYTHNVNIPPEGSSTLGHLKMLTRNGYLNIKWSMQRRPASLFLGLLAAGFLFKFSRTTDQEEMRALPRHGRQGRLLDVGCGNGSFIARAREAGWVTMGLDFDPAAVDAARQSGLDVREGGIELLANESEVFDAITLSHIIEHVYEPSKLLSDCYRLLRPGGYFWIETPNIRSFGHTIFGRNWRGLEPPRHLTLLNIKVLRKMLEDAGFKHIRFAKWRPVFEEIRLRSEAITRGLDPYRAPVGRDWRDRVITFLAESASFARYSRREFLTFTASK